MPSLTSSHAVRREPCMTGRVSSTQTSATLAALVGGADHAERGAVAGGGQRAGVAVGEHARARPAPARRRARPWRGWRRCPRRGWPAPRPGAGRAERGRRHVRAATATRRMRSSAQKRLTAVGRVAASPLMASSRSAQQRGAVRRRGSPARRAPRRTPRPRRWRARRAPRGCGSPRATSGQRRARALDLLGGQLRLVEQEQAAVLPADRRDHDEPGTRAPSLARSPARSRGEGRARGASGRRRGRPSTRNSLSREVAPRTSAITRRGDAERVGQQGDHRAVGLAVGGRRGHPHAEGARLPADDLVASRPAGCTRTCSSAGLRASAVALVRIGLEILVQQRWYMSTVARRDSASCRRVRLSG